jgi:ABC-type transporter Mla MlaB component
LFVPGKPLPEVREVNWAMVTKSPSTNLLSRFTHLFREPGQDGNEPDLSPLPPQPISEAQPTLAQRLERVQHHNEARTQELNQLRAIVRVSPANRLASAGAVPTQPAAAARDTATAPLNRSVPDKPQGPSDSLDLWWGTSNGELAANPARAGAPHDALDLDFDLDFTGLLAPSATELSAHADPQQSAPLLAEPAPDSGARLRQAALHYAAGEFAQAQLLLCELLQQPGLTEDAAERLTASLLEVYRCSGQQQCFDALALDYAQRFARSPAEWYALSDPSVMADTSVHRQVSQGVWVCPALLDQAAWADLLATNPAAEPVSRLDWRALRQIDSSLAALFSDRMRAWCEQPVQLQWTGVAALQAALQACAGTGMGSPDALWWLVQLDLLRLTQQQNAFEDLAIDYCMAFEVSPPSWLPAGATLLQDPELPAPPALDVQVSSVERQEAGNSQPAYAACELRGNVCGDTLPKHLRAASRSAGQVTVSCALLGRIDSSAAKALLDWLAECQARACEVQFVRLPQLVLLHLQTLGLQQYARLSTGNH